VPHGDAALQQEGADLVDAARALTDQPLSHAVYNNARRSNRSAVFVATNFIVGRCTASAIASA
jgi:hypothetical protein